MLNKKALAAAVGVPAQYQIERSLRFNSADSAYLNRTPASASNRRTWTWSAWVKRSALSSVQQLFEAKSTGTAYTAIYFTSGDALSFDDYDASQQGLLTTSAVYRDVSAWYHIVMACDTTQATSTNRLKLYVNGTQITAFASSTYPSQNRDTYVDSTQQHRIGGGQASGQFTNGYLTEVNFIDGQALAASDFGETDADTGIWKPKAFSGTYGTNGFYLDFSDNSGTTSTTLGKDYSGNSNNWTPNNFSVTAGTGNDSLVDTPTPYGTDTGAGGEVRGNYCTMNPLDSALTGLNNGNLQSGTSGAANWKHCRSTFSMPTGKWYWECVVPGAPDANNGYQMGVLTAAASNTADPNSASTGFYTRQNTTKYANGAATSTPFTSVAANDIVMFAFDADSGKLWTGQNGTWYNSGSPSAGTNESWSSVPSGVFPMAGSYGSSFSVTVNFGQRPFAYTAPSGFKALCTANLPTPTIGATATTRADDYFNTVLYTGNGSSQSITGVGFQPDLVWLKSRSIARHHRIFDVIRGLSSLSSDRTNAEGTSANSSLTAFNTDGFSITETVDESYNVNNETFVGWNWKGGGTGVSNTAGSITSTVSANTTSGFSVVTYTGNGTNGATFGHGLGVSPAMVIFKNRDNNSVVWVVHHKAFSNSARDYLILNNTDAVAQTASDWFAKSSTLITLSNVYAGTNTNTEKYVAYCFAEVAGFSAFGSYTGNGSTDGPFIYTGFRPAFVLLKRSSASGNNWILQDAKRDPYNKVTKALFPNVPDAEGTDYDLDFLSNGFKLRDIENALNGSGSTYVYAAFAENPFKYSLGR